MLVMSLLLLGGGGAVVDEGRVAPFAQDGAEPG